MSLSPRGRVNVNGEVAVVGQKVSDTDRITVDGKRIGVSKAFQADCRVFGYNKPVGVICTRSDPEGRPTVFDDMPKRLRLVSVGRLDFNTSGLLLFTTDGQLANQLMHPRYQIEREYLVRARGTLSAAAQKNILNGVEIDGQLCRANRLVRHDPKSAGSNGSHAWYRVILTEGKFREVRRMFEAVDHPVSRLKRIRFGTVSLKRGVKLGDFWELDEADVSKLVGASRAN